MRIQIKYINPEIIVAVGGTALEYFCPGQKISQIRGQVLTSRRSEGKPVYGIVHPAAALRDERWEPLILKDLKALKVLNLNKTEVDSAGFGPRSVE